MRDDTTETVKTFSDYDKYNNSSKVLKDKIKEIEITCSKRGYSSKEELTNVSIILNDDYNYGFLVSKHWNSRLSVMCSLNKPKDRAETIYKNLNEIIEKNYNGLNEALHSFNFRVKILYFFLCFIFLGLLIVAGLAHDSKVFNPVLWGASCLFISLMLVLPLYCIFIFLVSKFYKYYNFDTKKYRDNQKKINWFFKGLASLIIFSIILKSIIESFFH